MENIAREVIRILKDSLFRPNEVPTEGIPEDAVLVECIVMNVGFHKERLESHREEVRAILNEMPEQFHAKSDSHPNGQGGWTFLNLCNDKNGVQWGEHRDMEALCALGIGLGLAHFLLPREAWSALPGGLPYVAFTTSPADKATT